MVENLFTNSEAAGRDAEVITPLLKGTKFRLEKITSYGHPSPAGHWYDQPEAEWVLLARGTATLEFADSPPLHRHLRAGDFVTLPAHQRHRVAAVSDDAVWLALFYVLMPSL